MSPPLAALPWSLVGLFDWSHLLHVVASLFLLALCHICYNQVEKDYRSFLALGPGGTAYSFRGYTQLSFISLFRLRNPYLAPKVSPRLHLKKGFLKDLEARRGRRPELVGMAPQRQITQNCSKAMIQALQTAIRSLADEYPSHLHVATSAFERHNEALFSKFITFTEPNYYGEVVHSHSTDGSMHLTLHPEDVKTVLEKAWGERHPLAWGSSWWWRAPVPPGFMIVYGPRDEAELQQVKSIIRAAAWWVSGVDSRRRQNKSPDIVIFRDHDAALGTYTRPDSRLALPEILGSGFITSCTSERSVPRVTQF